MPLDGHSYLVAQGWAGKGSGLREGAISRPLAIPQKRTLAGVGKDRDEAFPFWDHLFSAAAKSIQLKVYNSDEESDGGDGADTTPALPRTSTGILSNRRPAGVTSTATSGAATPVESRPQYSLLVTAKREAARQNLYSRFFRGPVLGPDMDSKQGKPSCSSDGVSENVPDAEVASAESGMRDAETSESRKKGEMITERVKKQADKARRETRNKNIEGTSEVPDVQNDADEERRRRRREKKMHRDGEADKKRCKKKKDAEPCPALNIPSHDISEDSVYHQKKRRRKE